MSRAKLTMWVAVAMAAGVSLDGCNKKNKSGPAEVALKQDSPKSLLESLHLAAGADKIDLFVNAIEPSCRKPMADSLQATRQYIAASDALATAVEKKIGKEQAEVVRRHVKGAKDSLKAPSPLERAAEGEEINWGKVKIEVKDDQATATVAGSPDVIGMKKIGGQWFLVPPQATTQSSQELEQKASATLAKLGKQAAAVEELTQKVLTGAIAAKDFEESYARTGGAD